MNKEIKINKSSKSITFINNGIAFSQFGIADEILDLITNLQQNYERIYNENCKLREEHNITDISLLDENYNLQQEINKLTAESTEWESKCYDLQEENEELKDIVIEKDSQIKEMILQKTDYTAVNILEMKLEDYKSRCEKAIPMLKELNECIKDILGIEIDIKNISDIENILQNGSDDKC